MATSIKHKILGAVEQLYPTGRAMRFNGWRKKLHKAVALTDVQFYEDSVSILDSLIPDTDRFDADDCTEWERILGLGANGGNSLADRRAAIRRKMGEPGVNPAKLHYLHIQAGLQAAGFNVYVHENLFPLYPDGYSVQNPAVINPAILSQSQHGGLSQHGTGTQSAYLNNVVANSIYNSVDLGFDIGQGLRNTFFIGGQTLGTYANVTAGREQEFRQLILVLKPVQMVGILFINYT